MAHLENKMKIYSSYSLSDRLLTVYAILFLSFLYIPVLFLPLFSFSESQYMQFPITDWTFGRYVTMWKKTKPPCILLFGNDSFNYNKIISWDHVNSLSKTLNRIRINFIYKPLYPLYKLLVFSRKIYFKVKNHFIFN